MFNSMFNMKKTIESAAQKATDTFQFMMQEYKQEVKSQSVLSDLTEYLQDDSQMLRQKGEQKLLSNVKRYTILVDTCTILNEHFAQLMQNMLPILKENRKQILILASVVNELRKLGTRNIEMRENVRNACSQLVALQRQGVLRVITGDDLSFGDQDIYTFVTKNRVEKDLLVITFDTKLSEDLLKLNDMMSVSGRHVKVCRINRYGFLSSYHTPKEQGEPAGQPKERKPDPIERPAPAAGRNPEVPKTEAKQPGVEMSVDPCRLETCVDCGGTFVIHSEEEKRYLERGLYLPKRCRVCRQVRRVGKEIHCSDGLAYRRASTV